MHVAISCQAMMAVHRLMDIARSASGRFRRIEIGSRAFLPVALLLLSVGTFACGVAYTLASHKEAHEVRTRAMRARDSVEAIQSLLLQANAEFLLGLGSARASDYGWPIERVAEASHCFERLEEILASDSASLAVVAALRHDTARWVWQLADTAIHARAGQERATVDSERLLSTNRNLSRIGSRLAVLRAEQVEILRIDSDRTANRLFVERAVLASTAAIAFGLLLYAFAARHRAQLARQRVHVVAQESQRRFREYFDHHPLPMLIFDVETHAILAANGAAALQYGHSQEALCVRNMASLYAPEDLPAFKDDLRRFRRAVVPSGSAGLCRQLNKSGVRIFVELSYHFLDYAGHDACFVTAINVTRRKHAELALRLRSKALDAIGNGVLITRPTDAGNVIEYANPAFEKITGFAREHIVGCELSAVETEFGHHAAVAAIGRSLAHKADLSTILRSRREDGKTFWNQLHVSTVQPEDEAYTHHIAVINDVSELIESRDLLLKQARFDALTALPNRVMLAELLDQAIRQCGAFALLFVDIDHFKDVNDSLGHGAGDALLREAAVRLASAIGPDDAVARYGGDEFVILIDCAKRDDALSVALERVKRAFDAPIAIDDVQLHVQTSIGVTCYPTDGADAESLLRNADLAMYRAKALGRNGIQRFRAELAHEAKRRIALSRRLREALGAGAFELVYQPQIDTRSMTVTGVEALIRWNDAELGAVSPASFIPLAEELGLIASIDEWVLNTACAQAKLWESTLAGVRMSINVSPRQLARRDFHRTVREALNRARLSPERLEVEITERALVAQGALPTLRALSEIGVAIAIDDFGSGYSSLSYLRSFHADRLKIDMSFVHGIGKSREDEAIIRAILALAHSLQFEVVAEGVETEDQLNFLIGARCDAIQGYIFAPPVSAKDAPERIASLERISSRLVNLV